MKFDETDEQLNYIISVKKLIWRKVARMEIVATSHSDIGKWELLQFPGGGRIMFCGKRKEIVLVD